MKSSMSLKYSTVDDDLRSSHQYVEHAIDSRKPHLLLEHINFNEAAPCKSMIKLLQEVLPYSNIGYLGARGVALPRYCSSGTDGWLRKAGDPRYTIK